MKVNELLSRLKKVKRTGEGRYVACCPAHEDKSPSMTIYVTPKTVLLHCFAGCEASEILGAIGMEFSELYADHREHTRDSRISARDALEAIAFEALVVVATAGTMRQRNLSPDEMARLVLASGRIQAAREMI